MVEKGRGGDNPPKRVHKNCLNYIGNQATLYIIDIGDHAIDLINVDNLVIFKGDSFVSGSYHENSLQWEN